MNELKVMNKAELTARELNGELFSRWTSYIDASPKTIDTYSKAIKQFFIYLQENGIRQPQREDIVAYREYLKEDRREAIVGYYRMLAEVNSPFTRLRLRGLDEETEYEIEGEGSFYGDELMNAGLVTSDTSTGKFGFGLTPAGDFSSTIYLLKAEK